MQKYPCRIAVTDVLLVYTTEDSHPSETLTGFVIEDSKGNKCSAMLTKEQVKNLHEQLGNFLDAREII